MLRNQKYRGAFVHNARTHRKGNKHKLKFNSSEAEIYENGWIRLIDDETFEKAQDRLDKRANDSSKQNRTYNLTGLIRCGICGCSVTGRTSTRKKDDDTKYCSLTYKCNNKDRTICNCKSISLELLEDSALDVIKRHFFQKDSIQWITNYISDRPKKKTPKLIKIHLNTKKP